MQTEYVLVFIAGSSVDKAMCVAKKGYDNDDHDYILRQAFTAGVTQPEIIGQVDIPEHIANTMCECRIYIG